jgi:hypothetical protein
LSHVLLPLSYSPLYYSQLDWNLEV